ncbi:MAG TPA: hypothetical protein VKA13_06170 [Gammaproteobacteria bacterium]|nr:hypothetical protein [Gammaproteobacteria bacterium]
MRTRLCLSILLRIAGLLMALAIGGRALATGDDYTSAIRLAVDHWLKVQRPSGFLPYGFNFLEDKAPEPDTMSTANLARQEGTASVLADYYSFTGDPRVRPVLQKLLTAFRHHSLPIGKGRMQGLIEKLRLRSMPVGRYKLRSVLERWGLLFDKQGPGMVLSPNSDYSGAYTGTVALALLTELRFEHTSGDSRFSSLAQSWLEGLMELRIPGRGFREFPTSIDSAAYADGEAWLALAKYHELLPQDRRANDMLADLDDSLINIYGGEYKVDFYHWGAMAAAARYAGSKDVKFLDFIKDQTGAFLDRKQKPNSAYTCASVEGMANALAALVSAGQGGSELSGRARAWIAREMRKAQGLQIQPGQKEMVFSNARLVAPRLEEFAGSFLAGSDDLKTWVDYTSHCVSAMIKLQRQNWTSANK